MISNGLNNARIFDWYKKMCFVRLNNTQKTQAYTETCEVLDIASLLETATQLFSEEKTLSAVFATFGFALLQMARLCPTHFRKVLFLSLQTSETEENPDSRFDETDVSWRLFSRRDWILIILPDPRKKEPYLKFSAHQARSPENFPHYFCDSKFFTFDEMLPLAAQLKKIGASLFAVMKKFAELWSLKIWKHLSVKARQTREAVLRQLRVQCPPLIFRI